MINAFPVKLGISQQFSPKVIVTGRVLDAKIDLRAQFVSYVEASYDHEVTHDMGDQTHGCITLGASSNTQGLLKCFDLLTG